MKIKLGKLIKFIVSNFGPLVGFYLVNLFFEFKIAVIISIIFVFGEYFVLKRKKQEIGSFFYFSSFIVISFGIADLIIQEPFFYKFEATLTNLFFSVFFGLSLFKEKSIVQELAETQNRTTPEQTEDKRFFFRLFTILWCAYFVFKAAFYLWINFSTSLNHAFLIRLIFGKISFWIMMFLSVGMPRQIWKLIESLQLFPSQNK